MRPGDDARKREGHEPEEAPRNVPLGMAALTVAFAIWGGVYFALYAGDGGVNHGDQRTLAALAPPERSETVEASSLGAAMCAAVAAGWFSSFDDASKGMRGRIVARSEPIPANHERYLELFEVYKPVYERLAPVYADIDRFIGGAS